MVKKELIEFFKAQDALRAAREAAFTAEYYLKDALIEEKAHHFLKLDKSALARIRREVYTEPATDSYGRTVG